MRCGVDRIPGFSVGSIFNGKWQLLAPLAFESWFNVSEMCKEAKESFLFDWYLQSDGCSLSIRYKRYNLKRKKRQGTDYCAVKCRM